jgi:hypothetical protein
MTVKTKHLINAELNDIVSWKSKNYGTRVGRIIGITEYVDRSNKEHRYISCETIIPENRKPRDPVQEVVGNIKRFWLV